MKLVIMSCSGTKRPDVGELTALDRYDGPMWKTLRAQLARNPAAARAYASGDLKIWVLSGAYGFIPVDVPVPDYDERMTAKRLENMMRDPSYDFQRIKHFVGDAEAVLFAGGELYRNAMWKASGESLWQVMKIAETDGRGGIGEHRAQMAAWFTEQFVNDATELAA